MEEGSKGAPRGLEMTWDLLRSWEEIKDLRCPLSHTTGGEWLLTLAHFIGAEGAGK